MSSDDALIPIRKTLEALDKIQERLIPHLETLRQKESRLSATNRGMTDQSKDCHDQAEAQAAIALTLGTLHYMNAKLHGAAQAKVELNKARQLIEALRKVNPQVKDDTDGTENVLWNSKEKIVEPEDESTINREGGIQDKEDGFVNETNLSSADTSQRKDCAMEQIKKRKR